MAKVDDGRSSQVSKDLLEDHPLIICPSSGPRDHNDMSYALKQAGVPAQEASGALRNQNSNNNPVAMRKFGGEMNLS